MAAVQPVVEPSGCQHCGIPERRHYQQWKPPVGWHQHTAPTDPQILTRMKARRAARPTTTLKDKPMSNMPPVLATFTAATTLLTEHPGLAALPLRWTVGPDGDLQVNPPYCHPESLATVRALAAALGAVPYEYTVRSVDGEVLTAVSASGEINGMKIHPTGYELLQAALTAVDGSDS